MRSVSRDKSNAMVCTRCGVRCYLWNGDKRGDYWKHAANVHIKTCGQPPYDVVAEWVWLRQKEAGTR